MKGNTHGPATGLAQVAERAEPVALVKLADVVTPMAIRVVATLRVADELVDGPRTAAELARKVGAQADALDRVLRHLVIKRVMDRDAAGRYELTELGGPLRSDHPSGLRATLDIDSAIGRAETAFAHLLHTVRTGEPAYPAHFGRSFWEDIAVDPLRNASFDDQMAADVTACAPDIVAGYDWGALGHIVDVGGGTGALLAALLHAYPGLRGTVLEQPYTATAARRFLAEEGLADRADAVPGSFFDPLPPGSGGYLLCAVIHNWDDAAARRILRRCAEAAGQGGAVFVVDKIRSDAERPRTAMDLRGLAWFGGGERGVPALAALAEDSGLVVAAVHPAGELTIVELTAAA